MADTVGPLLLEYLLNCDSVAVQAILAGECSPSAEQLRVMEALSARRAALSKDLGEAGVREAVRHWLLQVGNDGRSTAGTLRTLTCRETSLAPPSADEMERTFAALARAVYTAFLIPTETIPIHGMPELADLLEEVDQRIPNLIASLSDGAAFIAAVAADESVGKVFRGAHATLGAYAAVYLNTGHGGPVFLKHLPVLMLRATWRQVRDAEPTEERFVTEALAQLAIVRRVLGGRTSKVRAKLAFTGVLMPADACIDLGDDGVVRPVTDADRRYAPGALEQRVGGAADAEGARTYISYAGDVVLDYPYRYKAWIPGPSHDVTAWQERVPEPVELDQVILWLRASLILAVEREHRAHIVQTWRHINDPLAEGIGISWSDPRWGRGLTPVQLTEAEVVAWGEWYRLLRASQAKRIELAITRVLKAVAERREPSDVLIDSVIAWENIFGTAEGEPTFRVTACLSKLLADSLAERRTRRRELTDIYKLRSAVVHGNRSLTNADFAQCDRALDVAIDAIRTLVDKRPDLLAEGDGGSRSTAVLLAD